MKILFKLILISIVISSCFKGRPVEKYDISPLLNLSFNKLENQDTVRFNFCEINEFEWEDLIIVTPYATMNFLDSLNLINKNDIRKVMKAVDGNDFRTIYLFINRDSIVRYQIFENKDYPINLYYINYKVPKGRVSKQELCSKLYIEKIDGRNYFKM